MENKINEPFLALSIVAGTLYFTKKLPLEDGPRVILELDISEVVKDDFDEAARKLGTMMFGILRLWHKDAFDGWGS
jgi:hypothetical protein